MTTDVERARAQVQEIAERFASPEAAQRTVTVTAELGDGLRMEIGLRKHRVTVDEPKSLGGTDEGPNPVELMLAALASCQAITYRVWAAKLGVRLDRVHVEVAGDIDLRGFYGVDDAVRPGYTAMRLHVALEGPETSERYRALADAVDAHCPVLDVAGNTVPVERTLA